MSLQTTGGNWCDLEVVWNSQSTPYLSKCLFTPNRFSAFQHLMKECLHYLAKTARNIVNVPDCGRLIRDSYTELHCVNFIQSSVHLTYVSVWEGRSAKSCSTDTISSTSNMSTKYEWSSLWLLPSSGSRRIGRPIVMATSYSKMHEFLYRSCAHFQALLSL